MEYSWFTIVIYNQLSPCASGVQLQVYSKVSQLYIYIYPFFFRFFSHIGCYRILSRAPCAIYELLYQNLMGDRDQTLLKMSTRLFVLVLQYGAKLLIITSVKRKVQKCIHTNLFSIYELFPPWTHFRIQWWNYSNYN